MSRQWKKKKDDSPIGKVNRSQVVSTFGIGSLYELRTFSGTSQVNSVIIAGLDYWPERELETIDEPVLAASLGVSEFKAPPADSGDDSPLPLPAFRFPEWLECSACHRLGKIGIHFEEQSRKAPTCKASGCGGYGIPVRLVTACFSDSDKNKNESAGHIDDFPWVYWAHSSYDGKHEICDQPELFIENTGNRAGLDGIMIRCGSCGKKRSLAGVFGAQALRNVRCYGNRPWLGNRQTRAEECDRPVRALLRGASNVFFPVTASAISIPPYSDKLTREIQKKKDVLNLISEGEITIQVAARTVQNGIPGFRRYTIERIEQAIQRVLDMNSGSDKPLTETDQRLNEREAIINGDELETDDSDEDFVSTREVITVETGLKSLVDVLCKVHRLREVRAFRGFQRIEPVQTGGSYKTGCAQISGKHKDWLPAIEVRGEGIYLELDGNTLTQWQQRECVKKRVGLLRANYEQYCEKKGITPVDESVEPRFVLIHTLSHLLIKQLSLDCGYSSASIRERLYSGEDSFGKPVSGTLLYTASASTDGTLGGLVRQGDVERIADTLKDAVNNARWCSSDPLCIESKGQGVDALNLAACHACCLVSETSCEQRNLFLDRALIVGTWDNPDVGFFKDLLN